MSCRNERTSFLKVRIAVPAFFFCLVGAASAFASPRVKVLKLAITNPTDENRLAEDIVVAVADLKRIAADFKPADVIVTTSDAATLEADARTPQTIELPSQADHLGGT